MWNSPTQQTKEGKRYQVADITALTYSLDKILDQLEDLSVDEVIDEPILQRLQKTNSFMRSIKFWKHCWKTCQFHAKDTPAPRKQSLRNYFGKPHGHSRLAPRPTMRTLRHRRSPENLFSRSQHTAN
jgi:hypothetical protein